MFEMHTSDAAQLQSQSYAGPSAGKEKFTARTQENSR